MNAYRELQDDGLLDILLGGVLLLFAVAESVEGVGGPAGAVWIGGLILLAAGFVFGRRRLTQPRVGWVGGSAELRRRKVRAAFWGAVVLIAGGVLFSLAASSMETAGPLGLRRGAAPALVLGATMFAFFGVLAVALGMRRLWLYAAIYGIPLPTAVLLAVYADVRIHPLVIVGVPALLAIAYGVVLLRRFLRTHSPPPPAVG